MRFLSATLSLCVLLSITGCDQAEVVGTVWQTNLVGQPGYESVAGSSSVVVEGGQSNASIEISGAAEGSQHPWHIHIGSCETDGPIFGEMTDYPDLNVGADGTAAASATVGAALDANASYFVNVHAAPDDLATIVACGNLSRSGGSNSPPPLPGNGDPY